MNHNEVKVRSIEDKIYIVRGLKVMLDSHLANLYQVETKALKRAVHRHLNRFPPDFMFALNRDEYNSLRCQIGTLESRRGRHSKYSPYVFTQEGVAMLSSVLNSPRAIQVNIQIMRAFVRLREWMAGNEKLKRRINSLELKFNNKFSIVFKAIRLLLDGPKRKVHVRGFSGN
jgi:hypothetical protein